MREEYYYGIFRSKHNMGAGRRRAGLLYAGRIRNGRNRLHNEPKTQGNIIMKNLMDFCIGTPVFWLVGFGLMFGAGNGFIGKIGGIATEAHYGSGMLLTEFLSGHS